MRWLRLIVLALCFVPTSFGIASAQTGDGFDRESPLPLGDTAELADYAVTVASVDFDAEDIVLGENSSNDPALDGNVFVLVTVSVTYIGNETGDPGWDLNFKTVGDQNRGYTQSDMDCGVVPNNEFDAGELFPTGEAEYNLCWQVTEDEAPSLVMYLEETFSFDDESRVYFSLDENTNLDDTALQAGSVTFSVELQTRGLYMEVDEVANTCSGAGFYRVIDAGSDFTVVDGDTDELLYSTILSAGTPQASSCAWNIAVLSRSR